MSPTKTSERTIIRIKDLSEQPPSRFVLLPGGLDRVIIGCEFYEIAGETITAYGPGGTSAGPLFSAPVASGYVLLDRSICDLETVEHGLRRMAADEKEAEQLHAELYGAEHKHDTKKSGETTGGKLRYLRPPDDPDFEPAPPTGQYL